MHTSRIPAQHKWPVHSTWTLSPTRCLDFLREDQSSPCQTQGSVPAPLHPASVWEAGSGNLLTDDPGGEDADAAADSDEKANKLIEFDDQVREGSGDGLLFFGRASGRVPSL